MVDEILTFVPIQNPLFWYFTKNQLRFGISNIFFFRLVSRYNIPIQKNVNANIIIRQLNRYVVPPINAV